MGKITITINGKEFNNSQPEPEPEQKRPSRFKFFLIGIFPHLLSLYWFIFHNYGEAVFLHTLFSYPVLFVGTKKWGWSKYRACLHLFTLILFIGMLIGQGDILFFIAGLLCYGVLVVILFMASNYLPYKVPLREPTYDDYLYANDYSHYHSHDCSHHHSSYNGSNDGSHDCSHD